MLLPPLSPLATGEHPKLIYRERQNKTCNGPLTLTLKWISLPPPPTHPPTHLFPRLPAAAPADRWGTCCADPASSAFHIKIGVGVFIYYLCLGRLHTGKNTKVKVSGQGWARVVLCFSQLCFSHNKGNLRGYIYTIGLMSRVG